MALNVTRHFGFYRTTQPSRKRQLLQILISLHCSSLPIRYILSVNLYKNNIKKYIKCAQRTYRLTIYRMT